MSEHPQLPGSSAREGGLQTRVLFKNEPRLSEFEAQATFNERRLRLAPQIHALVETSDLFAGTEVTAEFAHKGVSSLVCFLESEGKRLVLKVPLSLTDGNGEARFLREWEAAGVRVPHVLEDGMLGDHPYLIMEYVDAPLLQGLTREGTEPEGTWEEIGRTLARMHAPKAEGFGRIVDGKPEYGRFEDWLLGPGIEKRVNAVRELGLLGDEHGRIDKVFGALLAHAQGREGSSLCHFDLTPNNILATQPLTIFDPSPMLSHGIVDIGRSMLSGLLHDTPQKAERMRDGYFGAGAEYDAPALQASIILNAYWRFVYLNKTGRTAEMDAVRGYLAQTSHIL